MIALIKKINLKFNFIASVFLLPVIIQAQSTIDWVLEAKNIDYQTGMLYGTGSGKTLSIAKNNALADLAGFLSTNVKSSSISQDNISRGEKIEESSRFSQNVQTATRPLAVSAVETDRSEYIDGRYYLRIKLSGKKLAAEQIANIKKIIKELNQELTSFNGGEDFKQLVLLSKYDNDIKKNEDAFFILDTLDSIKADFFFPFENYPQLRNDFNALIKRYNSLLASIEIAIVSLNEQLGSFVDIAEELIHDIGIKTIPNADKLNRQQGILTISGTIEDSEFYNAKIASIFLKLNLADNKKGSIGSKTYQIRELSPFSVSVAARSAAQKWKKKFADKNILATIFNEQN